MLGKAIVFGEGDELGLIKKINKNSELRVLRLCCLFWSGEIMMEERVRSNGIACKLPDAPSAHTVLVASQPASQPRERSEQRRGADVAEFLGRGVVARVLADVCVCVMTSMVMAFERWMNSVCNQLNMVGRLTLTQVLCLPRLVGHIGCEGQYGMVRLLPYAAGSDASLTRVPISMNS